MPGLPFFYTQAPALQQPPPCRPACAVGFLVQSFMLCPATHCPPLPPSSTLACTQGTTLMGINKKPVNEAARHGNMLKAIDHLRTLPNMSRRCACGTPLLRGTACVGSTHCSAHLRGACCVPQLGRVGSVCCPAQSEERVASPPPLSCTEQAGSTHAAQHFEAVRVARHHSLGCACGAAYGAAFFCRARRACLPARQLAGGGRVY